MTALRGPLRADALPEHNRYLNRLAPTPLVPVRLGAGAPVVWCKLEFLHPSGSTKDRIAQHILEKAWRQGRLCPGDLVVEASSGSTSIAFALACAQYGLQFLAVMPESVSHERVLLIRAYGGAVRFTSKADGLLGAMAEAARVAAAEGAFYPQQFANPDNVEAHRVGTAREVLAQVPGGTVDIVVSGVGTGGTLVGLYRGLADGGCAVTRQLHRLGFPVGPSSGLNYRAAVLAVERRGSDPAVAVTVFPDRVERYFSTELFQPVP